MSDGIRQGYGPVGRVRVLSVTSPQPPATSPSLSGPRAKLDRADEHRHLLDRELREFHDAEPLALTPPIFDPETQYFVMYGHTLMEAPPRLGAILGDYVNNVRAALDHLVWQLVVLNGGSPTRKHNFPICSSPAEFESRKEALKCVASEHHDFIEQLQPYHQPQGADQHVLRVLQWLSNVDKHRVVHPVLTFTRDADPDQAGFRLVQGQGELQRPQVNIGADWARGEAVVRVRLEPPDPNAQLEWYGQIGVAIVFGERKVRHEIIQELHGVGVFVVEHFASDFGR